MWLLYYFYFERNYELLNSKSPCFLFNKTIIETESKMGNPTKSFRQMNHALQNCEAKVKLWWVGSRERGESAFFVTLILSEGNLFNIWVLSQCIAHWINLQNIYTFTYQKTLLHTLLLLVFKMVESLQSILNQDMG